MGKRGGGSGGNRTREEEEGIGYNMREPERCD